MAFVNLKCLIMKTLSAALSTRAYACALCFFLLSATPLWGQDDATLIDITTEDQLDAMRYDLDGDGVVSATAVSLVGDTATFGTPAHEEAVLGDAAKYAAKFMGGLYYDDADASVVDGSDIEVGHTYTYKLPATPYTGYELTANLDLTTSGLWAPVGDNATRFTATFEGNGHTISGLSTDPNFGLVGLFGCLGDDAEVRNVGIVRGSVTTSHPSGMAGGLAALNRGTIRNCYAAVTVTGGANTGGLVGSNTGMIIGCYATGDATSNHNAGGLVGNARMGTITGCYATGDATAPTSDGRAGGLVGISSLDIRACYATGTATGSDTGGLIGLRATGTVINCYYDRDLSGLSDLGKGEPKTSYELQGGMVIYGGLSTAIYYGWNIDKDGNTTTTGYDVIWDFGTAVQYPVLRGIDSNSDFRINDDDLAWQREAFPLARVGSLTVDSVTQTTATLSWDTYAGATEFLVHRSTTPDFTPDSTTFFSDTIPGADTGVTVTLLTSDTLYYFKVAALKNTKAGLYTEVSAVTAGAIPPPNYDADDNGLIDITTEEQLDAMRYDLDGDGRPTSAGLSAYNDAFGTAITVADSDGGDAAVPGPLSYRGYELRMDLDFMGTGWEDGALGPNAVTEGWPPIGDNSTTSDSSRFTAEFEGNNHTISNLYINSDVPTCRLVWLFG